MEVLCLLSTARVAWIQATGTAPVCSFLVCYPQCQALQRVSSPLSLTAISKGGETITSVLETGSRVFSYTPRALYVSCKTSQWGVLSTRHRAGRPDAHFTLESGTGILSPISQMRLLVLGQVFFRSSHLSPKLGAFRFCNSGGAARFI